MAQRRGIDELKGQTAGEEVLMLRIRQLQQDVAAKKSVEASLKEALRSVEIATDRLVEEDLAVETETRKTQDKIREAADEIERRKDRMEGTLLEAEDRVYGVEADIRRQRESMEQKIEFSTNPHDAET